MMRANNLRIIFCFFFVLLGGCAALKKRNFEPEVTRGVEVSTVVDSALKTPDFEAGEWPAYNWWNLFGDDQLSEMMEAAIENNPDLMAAVSRVRSAEAETKKVRSSLIPQLSGEFKDDYQHLSKDSLDRYPPSTLPAVVNQIFLALNFEYEIDLFGKNRNRYRAAVGQARAQAAEMSQSLLMITTLLAQTYFNYAANRLSLELCEEWVNAEKMLYLLTEKRVEYGLEDQRALDQAAASLYSAEEEVASYIKEVALNESQLNLLMGKGPDAERGFKMPTADMKKAFGLPNDIPLNLLSRRPDLMAQIWVVESAAYLISASKAAFFPNINLKAFAGLESLQWNNLLSKDSFAGAISPAINLPFFTGGKLTGQLQESYANYDAAVYDYNALVLKAAKEVSDQIKIIESVSEELRLQEAATLKVLNISTLTDKRFQNGIDDTLTVLNRQIDFLKAGIKEVGIQNERQTAIVQLIKSLGGGYGTTQ